MGIGINSSIVRNRAAIVFVALWSVGLALIGCGGDDGAGPQEDLRSRFNLQTLGSTPYPPDNEPRQERIALGRLLFFDPILGGEMDVSCGTCHHPNFAFTDRRQFAAGVSGRGLGPERILTRTPPSEHPIGLTPRNTPTVLNAAFNADETGLPTHEGFQFWDGRVKSMEVQATKPITSRIEMRGDAFPGTEAEAVTATMDSILLRLRAIPEYVLRFRDAFPHEAVDFDAGSRAQIIDSSTYARAIGAYERELVTRHSPYDRYVRGDDAALDDVQKHGLELFFTKGQCASCHSGSMFSDFRFVIVGTPQEGPGMPIVAGDDLGRGEYSYEATDEYAFRTPSLRNVELTPPYMHDGVFESLEEVVRFFNDGAMPRHQAIRQDRLDPALREPLGLTDEEVFAIVEFLRALTDPGTGLDPFLVTVPDRVPSGLTPVVGMGATAAAGTESSSGSFLRQQER